MDGRRERPARGRASSERALIDAALELVVTSGVHGVSVRAIADRAGVNHGLVHHYFGSKAGLLAATLDDINERANAVLEERGPSAILDPDVTELRLSMGYLARLIMENALPADVPQRFPVIDRLTALGIAGGLDETQARLRSSQIVSLFVGWFLLEPYIALAMGKDKEGMEGINELRQELIAAGRRLAFGS